MKERNKELDVLRGVSILAVIFGHRTSFDSIMPNVVLYSFHLPIFLFISGYFFRRHFIVSFLKKTTFRLLVPFFIFAMIRYLIISEISEWLFAIWYLISFWFAINVYNFIRRFRTSFFIVLLVFLPLLGIYLYNNWLSDPLYFIRGLCMLPFIAVGELCCRYDFLNKITTKQAFSALSFWGLAVCFSKNPLRLAFLEFPFGLIGDIIVALCAFLFLYKIVHFLINRNINLRIIEVFGNFSMIVLCIHSIDIILLGGFPWVGAYWKYTVFLGAHAYNTGFLIIELLFIFICISLSRYVIKSTRSNEVSI